MLSKLSLDAQTALMRWLWQIEESNNDVVKNTWVWVVVVLVAIITWAWLAYQCVTRGYNIALGFKLHWPDFWHLGVQCSK